MGRVVERYGNVDIVVAVVVWRVVVSMEESKLSAPEPKKKKQTCSYKFKFYLPLCVLGLGLLFGRR